MVSWAPDRFDMPIHEYVCNDCSHAFEMLVRRPEAARCPECRSAALDRRLSVFAVGAGRAASAAAEAPAPCGACGDVRGPGACSLN